VPKTHRNPRLVLTLSRAGLVAEVYTPGDLPEELWPVFEAGLRDAPLDHRYHLLTMRTLTDRFEHLLLVLREADGRPLCVQPVFLVREDLLAGVPARLGVLVRAVRALFPNALRPRMLMLGCCAGEGHLSIPNPALGGRVAEALAAALMPVARRLGAALVVVKETPARYRPLLKAPMLAAGFAALPSMPAAGIDLAHRDFDAHLAAAFSKSRRADLRRKFRAAAEGGPLELTVVNDVGPLAEEVHALYQNVFERSALRFEHLTPDYFRGLGEAMPDRARFFLWRRQGRLVAFSACTVHNGVVKDNYLGLDYAVALDLHLYFVTWRDVLSWAMANGCRAYWTAALNYHPKLDLKMHLEPLDLYTRHTNPLLNSAFKRVVRLFGPTRGEPLLKRFPNFAELDPLGPSRG
jgi:hypothetical protein